MSFGIRAGKAMDEVYSRLRHRESFAVSSGELGTFDALRGHKYALMVTFRRSGVAVPTPIWFGLSDDGKVYTRTRSDAGKVKRVHNDPSVLLTPCTLRGKPLATAIQGRGCLVPREEWEHAERVIEANYGLGRRMYQLPMRASSDAMTYLEITPASAL